MKKLTLLFTITAFVAGNLCATTRTVSNHPNGGAQYATLAAAYAASANGDTLLLEGTDIPYEFTDNANPWAKPLTVIGIGFNPNKTSLKRVKIQGVGALPFNLNSSGNFTSFYGIYFVWGATTTSAISNYSFFDCWIREFFFNSYGSTNLFFTNSIFLRNSGLSCISWNGGIVDNITFLSCIFNNVVDNNGATISNINISNCVFGLSGSLPVTNFLYNINNSVIRNCIFWGPANLATIAYPTTSGCIFENNLSRYSANWPSLNGNISNNNLSNLDPLFVNAPNASYYDIFNPINDYHLQAGSPAIGAGFNGSDIGPHGSASNFSETGEVLIAPIVRSLSTSLGAGNTLNINVNATKPNDN